MQDVSVQEFTLLDTLALRLSPQVCYIWYSRPWCKSAVECAVFCMLYVYVWKAMEICTHGDVVYTQAEEHSIQAQQCGQGQALQQSSGVEDVVGKHICMSAPLIMPCKR